MRVWRAISSGRLSLKSGWHILQPMIHLTVYQKSFIKVKMRYLRKHSMCWSGWLLFILTFPIRESRWFVTMATLQQRKSGTSQESSDRRSNLLYSGTRADRQGFPAKLVTADSKNLRGWSTYLWQVPGADVSHRLCWRWSYRQKDLEASWDMGGKAQTPPKG